MCYCCKCATKVRFFLKGLKDDRDYKVSKDSKDDKEGGLDFQSSRLLDSRENPTKKHKNAHTLAYIKKK